MQFSSPCRLFSVVHEHRLQEHSKNKHNKSFISLISYFKVPWINSDIIEAKRQSRKAERKWRTTRCQSDLILFRKSRNYVTFLMNKARQDYSDLISNNSNDLKHLFKVSKNLLNTASTTVLPPHEDKQQLANETSTLLIFVPISIIIHHKSAELTPMTPMIANSISLSPS